MIRKMMFTVYITLGYDSIMMFIVHIRSAYDSLLYTSHHLVILTMMLFVHITSAYDSKNDVMCTRHIAMILKMMSCAHVAPGL